MRLSPFSGLTLFFLTHPFRLFTLGALTGLAFGPFSLLALLDLAATLLSGLLFQAQPFRFLLGLMLTAQQLGTLEFLFRNSRHCPAGCIIAQVGQELEILTGTPESVELCDQVRKELRTDDPDVWIPVFLERLKVQKHVSKQALQRAMA